MKKKSRQTRAKIPPTAIEIVEALNAWLREKGAFPQASIDKICPAIGEVVMMEKQAEYLRVTFRALADVAVNAVFTADELARRGDE